MKFLKTFPMGYEVDPVDIKAEQIHIRDIANALSNVCRYTGHVQKFYSVAQHSVLVAAHLGELGFGKEVQLWGLLHDATEAYLGDVTRKLKKELKEYRRIENRLNKIILTLFNVPTHIKSLQRVIKDADNYLLEYEKSKLLQGESMPEGFCWSPEKARALFLSNYWTLTAPVSKNIVAR